MSQVERLQVLLERVQQNRARPRERAGVLSAVSEAQSRTAVNEHVRQSGAAAVAAGGAAATGQGARTHTGGPSPVKAPAAPVSSERGAAEGLQGGARPAVAPARTDSVRPMASPPQSAVPSQGGADGQTHETAAAQAQPLQVAARAGAGRDTMPEAVEVPLPPEPARPIAQLTHPAPEVDAPSFGELLMRSLALRPR